MAYRKFDRLAGDTPGDYQPDPAKTPLAHYCYGCKGPKTVDDMAFAGICVDHYIALRGEAGVK
jgi:hypothetical protein